MIVLVGDMKNPSTYMHSGGWTLRGWIWLYSIGASIVGVDLRGMSTLGVVFHVLENLM